MIVASVVGARPQFVKVAVVSRALRRMPSAPRHLVIDTGQHYDHDMSRVFFEQLDLPSADINLGIGGGNHGEMTGAMLAQVERVLLEHQPSYVLVYGDTNSTLAGALAAAKLHVRVGHVEAGLRSWNRKMPEELNRVVTDHVSDDLFCPTDAAVENLAAENIRSGVHQVGDVMYDAALFYGEKKSGTVADLGLTPGAFFLATCHRAENTDDPQRLAGILDGLSLVSREFPVVLPMHPRTRKTAECAGLVTAPTVRTISPVGYLEMVDLERNARAILTDSGGVQKEAYFHSVPCITLRQETEWPELVSAGWNVLCDTEPSAIAHAVKNVDEVRARARPQLFGDGDAGGAIARILARILEGEEVT